MEPATLVRRLRTDSALSLRSLAAAAGLATSTVHRIEKGELRPTVETLQRIAEAAGVRLRLVHEPDPSSSLVGLAIWIRTQAGATSRADTSHTVRLAAELVHRFQVADADSRRRMIAAPPPPTGDLRWDAFLDGLAEWLAVGAGVVAPAWTLAGERFLDRGWWVTPMDRLHAWELAGTPQSLKRRGVYLHAESLTNV